MNARERDDEALFYEWHGLQATLLRDPLPDDEAAALRVRADDLARHLKRIPFYQRQLVALGW